MPVLRFLNTWAGNFAKFKTSLGYSPVFLSQKETNKQQQQQNLIGGWHFDPYDLEYMVISSLGSRGGSFSLAQ